jgi:hypothetical protein
MKILQKEAYYISAHIKNKYKKSNLSWISCQIAYCCIYLNSSDGNIYRQYASLITSSQQGGKNFAVIILIMGRCH